MNDFVIVAEYTFQTTCRIMIFTRTLRYLEKQKLQMKKNDKVLKTNTSNSVCNYKDCIRGNRFPCRGTIIIFDHRKMNVDR